MHYFDYNATSPILPEARAVWLEAVEKYFANPSSQHRLGLRAYNAITNAREELAFMVGCHPLDIVWTSGATESANMVIHHFYKTISSNKILWISPVEHPAVLEPAKYYFKDRLRYIPIDNNGEVSVDWIEANIKKENPGAVIVMAVNNETGVIQPFKKISEICKNNNIPYFCDATQWVGKLPVKELASCDYFCAGAHKFGGARGTGFLKCGSNSIRPLLHGGGQEEGRRSGTENVAGILAMVTALKVCEEKLKTILETRPSAGKDNHNKMCINQPKEKIAIREEFEKALTNAIPDLKIVGKCAQRIWNTVCLIMPGAGRNFRWVVKLDKSGFLVSSGSACASGKEKASYVLKAMGYSDSEASRGIRCSGGWETVRNDWIALKNAILSIYLEATHRNDNPIL